MKLTSEEVLSLTFGTQIKIIYHNSKSRGKNETYKAVVYGDKIGYEDGLADNLRTIAEQVYNDQCEVYTIN